jgi:hypothetical protein
MQTNPSRTFGYVEAQTELSIVQIVPEAPADQLLVDALEPLERAGEVRLPKDFILV